ncbi:hypothetical protein [Georgenia sp. TF02-10]|uniref:hypothetical protein n=1 Tax=Georgenia sp. TF02-10 TaxID=2917725 RepID=UPI00352DA759
MVLLALAVGAVLLALHLFVRPAAAGTCTVTLEDGTAAELDADQAANAALFAAVATHRELPARAVSIAVATAMQESRLRNIDYGDRDSVGLFQQRPSQGWGTVEQIMDPVYSTNAFYDVLVTVEGWQGQEITDAAQRVQRSAFPDAYAQHEGPARAFASALTGHSPAALACHLDPVDDQSPAAGAAGGAAGTGTAAGAGTATGGGTAGEDGAPADGAAAAAANGPADADAEASTPTQRLQVVQDRLARDFVDVTTAVAPGGLLTVDATSLPGGTDAGRLGWAVAHWAVATASETGASVVAVDGRAWLRADGDDAGWVPLDRAPEAVATAAATAGPGAVVIG